LSYLKKKSIRHAHGEPHWIGAGWRIAPVPDAPSVRIVDGNQISLPPKDHHE
jgi:hypothetical protein